MGEKIDKNKIISISIIGSIIIIVLAIVVVCSIIILKPIISSSKESNDEYLKRIEAVMKKIKNEYVEDIDFEKITEGAIRGITESTGDPYTRYMTNEEYTKLIESGNEKYNGLGIHITYDNVNKGIIVLSLMPNSPAIEEGIQVGDLILKVNELVVNTDNYYECVDAIKGEENTKVKLTIKRNENVFEGEYTRKKIIANNIEVKKIDNNIGYIKILSFENEISNQFKIEYDRLLKENISGLIIDLRNNPGGLLTETVKIANMLLPKGEVVKLVYRDGKEKVYPSDGNNEIKIPLTVLVNERSASASEILAGSIKDSKKGTIIGMKTFGKGIVQTVEKLDVEGAISLTTSKYYTSSGVEIHKNGIEPNIEVKLSDDYINKLYIPIENDSQLLKAIEVLKQK
jgi:carboxyl-terminal processing protease